MRGLWARQCKPTSAASGGIRACRTGCHEELFVVARFSHPVGVVPRGALSVNDGAGAVEKVVSSGPSGSLCSAFLVYAKAWDRSHA